MVFPPLVTCYQDFGSRSIFGYFLCIFERKWEYKCFDILHELFQVHAKAFGALCAKLEPGSDNSKLEVEWSCSSSSERPLHPYERPLGPLVEEAGTSCWSWSVRSSPWSVRSPCPTSAQVRVPPSVRSNPQSVRSAHDQRSSSCWEMPERPLGPTWSVRSLSPERPLPVLVASSSICRISGASAHRPQSVRSHLRRLIYSEYSPSLSCNI